MTRPGDAKYFPPAAEARTLSVCGKQSPRQPGPDETPRHDTLDQVSTRPPPGKRWARRGWSLHPPKCTC